LLWFSKRTRREDFNVFNFKVQLFAQLAPQRIDRLFTSFEKAARQTPTTSGAKPVFEKKYLTVVIEDECAGGDGEARVQQAHAPATQARRKASPDFTDEIMKTSHG